MMTIEKVAAGGTVRSRIGKATASYFHESNRVVLVADKGDFAGAAEALIELGRHVMGETMREPFECTGDPDCPACVGDDYQ